MYRYCRIVFGVNFSQFLLVASLSYLLSNISLKHKKLADKLKYFLCVDNCITGVSNSGADFIEQAKHIMFQGSFNLRNSESNVNSKYSGGQKNCIT